MPVRRLTTLLAFLVVTVSAQQKLQNTGKPMALQAYCSAADIQALGLSCTAEEPCPLLLELAAFESTGQRLFVSGNIHTSTTTIHSLLLATDDGGQNWYEPVERIRSACLDQIQFLDLEHGWVAGGLFEATPRDPFLLVTTDGGRNWRRRSVYPESRPGIIESFWFDSRTSGLMTLDRIETGGDGARYELYESMTGGESWSLREVGRKPLTLKRRALDPDTRGWRLRPDAASKSFHIEKRQGEQWQSVAGFLIAAGACKPPE